MAVQDKFELNVVKFFTTVTIYNIRYRDFDDSLQVKKSPQQFTMHRILYNLHKFSTLTIFLVHTVQIKKIRLTQVFKHGRRLKKNEMSLYRQCSCFFEESSADELHSGSVALFE